MTNSRRGFGVVVAVAFFLAVLPGCKQILGLHDRTEGQSDSGVITPPKPTVGMCGSLRHPSAQCAACMDKQCCGEATACHGDPACDPAFDCLVNCGDDGACRARCATFFTRAEPLMDVNACRENHCRAECGLSCGGFGYPAPGCDSCIKDACCAEAAACAANVDCVKLDFCKYNCIAGSMDCPGECQATYPGGADDLAAWFDCLQNTCATSCETGKNWQCLDAKQPWLKPKTAGDITFSVTVVDVQSERPFVGSLAKACKKSDRNCATPLFSAYTDENGIVSLTVPVGSVGFDGYVDVTGGRTADGTPIYPAIWYPMPSIISSGWRGRIQFVSEFSLKLLAELSGAVLDPNRGYFAANAQDCNFASAGYVSFTAEPSAGSKAFYFKNGLPNTDIHETDPFSGIGGFINLPADQLVLITSNVTVNGEMKTAGSATYIIRPSTFTTTSIPPTP